MVIPNFFIYFNPTPTESILRQVKASTNNTTHTRSRALTRPATTVAISELENYNSVMSTGMATNVHHSNPNFLYPTNNRSQQTQLCLSDGTLFFPSQIPTFLLRVKLKIGGEARARLIGAITEQLADWEALCRASFAGLD